jgi:adenine-specific DNA-methyltransferase
MTKKQKLELTWIGKEKRPKLEPRILLEDAEKSYHARHRVTDGDIFDNRLIFCDNLLALKALEQEFTGKVKCVFIDPPYNTGSAFTHYDDGLEHSIWLGLMRDRLEIIRRLLAEDGSLWITIDDNEAFYLKVLCDEVFGRANFVSSIVWAKRVSPANDAKYFSSDHDFILVYAKNKPLWKPNRLPRTEVQNSYYKNPDNDPRGPWNSITYTGNKTREERPNLYYKIINHVLGLPRRERGQGGGTLAEPDREENPQYRARPLRMLKPAAPEPSPTPLPRARPKHDATPDLFGDGAEDEA